ncbi:hypothetical protein PRO82_001958 [Candidatus Protochlamydia amoebophila]|nr:hypothetical protein [Candidatus Protochlamydia amoebophila]
MEKISENFVFMLMRVAAINICKKSMPNLRKEFKFVEPFQDFAMPEEILLRQK